jgi:hypothetical protein
MRGLCKGKMHQLSNINDTVMFLAIARAMSVTLDVDGCSEYRSRFSSDLSRWQILITGQSLEDSSHTVKYIWRVTLDSERSNTADQAALGSLQELAVRIVSRADVCLHGLL